MITLPAAASEALMAQVCTAEQQPAEGAGDADAAACLDAQLPALSGTLHRSTA